MSGVLILFFVANRPYAQRRWHAIPRVGDEVMLGPSKSTKKAYCVVRVVWGVEADDAPRDQQDVNIELKRVRVKSQRAK